MFTGLSWQLVIVPLLAQATSSDWIQVVQTLGFPTVVAGVVGWVVVSGRVPREAEIKTLLAIIDAKDKEKARLEGQVDQFTKQYENVVLPTVHDALSAIREAARVIEQQTAAARSTEEAIKRMDETIRTIDRTIGRTRDVK